jgi:hypothetical protein
MSSPSRGVDSGVATLCMRPSLNITAPRSACTATQPRQGQAQQRRSNNTGDDDAGGMAAHTSVHGDDEHTHLLL